MDLAHEVDLTKQGEFVVASGASVPNFGKVTMPAEDEQGASCTLTGAVTAVHKPLGSGAQLSSKFDSFVGSKGGVLVPKDHPVAREMQNYYKYLTEWYGKEGFIRLYREGNLFNFYIKETGPSAKAMGSVETSQKQGNVRQATPP